MKVYWNGQIVDESEVSVSPWDLGFLRGYGVFDYISVYNGKPFEVATHLNRLRQSAREIGLTPPLSKEGLHNIILKLIEQNDFQNGAIRIVLTGGVSLNGISANEKPSLLIRPEISAVLKKELYELGGSLITTEYERGFASAKTTQYIEALRHEQRMRESGAVEILYIKNKHILECSRSNIFIFSDDILITPKENILPGITRRAVLEEASRLHIPTQERAVSTTELSTASEVFITGTGKKIVPIVRIDEQKISSGLPGEVTKKLISAYEARTRK